MGVNRTGVGEMGLAQKNMNAPQWVQGLRMCSNYRFILQWMEKRQRTPTPANGGDRDATSLSGLKNYRNLETSLGSFSAHV